MCDMPGNYAKERDEHRARRDSEVLRDGEEIRSDTSRMKAALRHLMHAKNAMERGSGGARKRKGFRGKVRD